MRLEKLITTNPIWDFFTETFDLLQATPFEHLVFRHNQKGAKSVYPGFPDAAGAGARRSLKSTARPLPTHPGMKYFRKETLAVDVDQIKLQTASLGLFLESEGV